MSKILELAFGIIYIKNLSLVSCIIRYGFYTNIPVWKSGDTAKMLPSFCGGGVFYLTGAKGRQMK